MCDFDEAMDLWSATHPHLECNRICLNTMSDEPEILLGYEDGEGGVIEISIEAFYGPTAMDDAEEKMDWWESICNLHQYIR